MKKILISLVIILIVIGLVIPMAPALANDTPALPGGTLSPLDVPKYEEAMIIPPAMPTSGKVVVQGGKNADYYEIAVRQFEQYILPQEWSMDNDIDPTTVWSYGSVQHPGTVAEGGSFNYPAFTIEAQWNKPIRVKWINDLVDEDGDYLPHLLPVDPTLHWANPPGGEEGRDTRPDFDETPELYTGPVPIITHVHGAHTTEDSDGYPEAWYLPDAEDIPEGYAEVGSLYEEFKAEAIASEDWEPGAAVFQYANDQKATTLWYHDHTLGMTRLNVYAGPAGFYLLRGGPDGWVGGKLPGPAPAVGDKPDTKYFEIPIAIQDRSFNDDGSLFYPDERAFFDEYPGPFIPDTPVSPAWNPEFFGNTMVVNGKTWPYLEVEQKRYRLRLLNGSQSRFMILKMSNDQTFWQIGADGGFLPAPVELEQLLLGPAERADVIVDFTDVSEGTEIILENIGPDEPFKGFNPDGTLSDGEGGVLPVADPDTTGQVMQFRVIAAAGPDTSTPPSMLVLPPFQSLGAADNTRQISLNEEVYEPADIPIAALLGTVNLTDPDNPAGNPLLWGDNITENPALDATEVWEIYNFTEDAHPIHIHLVQFQVVERQVMGPGGDIRGPETWEAGYKDTVIAYPGEITRVKARFDKAGLFVWHCHILEHEDNEMMRPYRVGP